MMNIWPNGKKNGNGKSCRPPEVQEELDSMSEADHDRVFREAKIAKKMKGKM